MRALALLLLLSACYAGPQSREWHPKTVALRERVMDLRMRDPDAAVPKLIALRNPYPRPVVALVECSDGMRELVVEADEAEAWLVFAARERVWESSCRLCGWEFLEDRQP